MFKLLRIVRFGFRTPRRTQRKKHLLVGFNEYAKTKKKQYNYNYTKVLRTIRRRTRHRN